MALRRTGSAGRAGGSGAAVRALLLVPALLALLFSFPAREARAADPDEVLAGSGIRYPDGFDADTVGEVRGRVSGTDVPGSGPVGFRVDTDRERYTVLASPSWYWKDLRVDLPDGSEVRVRGSKSLGKDMALYLVAQEVQLLPSGKRWLFRDADGHALWKGRKGPAAGSGMGAASPMRRGGGGFGGGPGGPGGRRR